MPTVWSRGASRVIHGDCIAELRALPDNSVDAVVTDPPYGLSALHPSTVSEVLARWHAGERDYLPTTRGFMGTSWDAFVPPPALWDECLRVLKPGGYLAAFSGARTVDLMGLSIRTAGFEVKDVLAWIYSNGFPKSMNVARAVATEQAKPASDLPLELTCDEKRFCDWLREHGGLTEAQHRKLFGDTRLLEGVVRVQNTANRALPPRMARLGMVPTAAAWAKARPLLATEPPAWVDALVKTTPNEEAGRFLDALHVGGVVTRSESEDDEPWAGWGTALKPAVEPVVLARKPLGRHNIAANVLEFGTGAINIDAARVGSEGGTRHTGKRAGSHAAVSCYGNGLNGNISVSVEGLGRFPANVLLDESAVDHLTARHGDVAKFFYCAKASPSERPVLADGTRHPTVKPLAVMDWLLALLVPEGGVVLDPFGGSGTTAEAALLRGVDFVTVEREQTYVELILQRMRRSTPAAAVPASTVPLTVDVDTLAEERFAELYRVAESLAAVQDAERAGLAARDEAIAAVHAAGVANTVIARALGLTEGAVRAAVKRAQDAEDVEQSAA